MDHSRSRCEAFRRNNQAHHESQDRHGEANRMTTTADNERDTYRPPQPMTKQEKLERIRQMRAELKGETEKESNRE
jgi:hypothetical protein